MEIGDNVVYTDERGVEHNAKVEALIDDGKLANVCWLNKGREVRGELIPVGSLKEGEAVVQAEEPTEDIRNVEDTEEKASEAPPAETPTTADQPEPSG